MPAVKLDENVPDSVGMILTEAGHHVALARDEQLAGAPDARLLLAATKTRRNYRAASWFFLGLAVFFVFVPFVLSWWYFRRDVFA